jgi:glycosyltransferase involved in cell wall biosynthesis
MTTPRFSILIPTRERPATLRHTLATVVSQPGDDYEIVVADNCSGPETRQIVEALASPKVRHARSDEILPMAENWERGLDLCSGEYITVLGDDDAFLPSTLEMARKLLAATGAELISWSPHTYWWPDTIVPWNRNLLIVDLRDGAIEVESRPILERFYRGEVSFDTIPMIYSAFFHRGLIDEARLRYDGFFVPKDTAPDISSGILGLHITQNFILSRRPLSLRGNSGKSNGTAHWARSLGEKQREIYFREERAGLQEIVHKSLVPSPNLRIILASAMLKCKETYFPGDGGLSVDLHGLLGAMVADLNFEPEAYEENLQDAWALAAKLGVKLDPATIPAKRPIDRKRAWGPAIEKDGSISRLYVNCDLTGVRQIVEAASLVDALLPSSEGYLISRDADPGGSES